MDENGRTYGYLFWEGNTKVPMDLSEGFCVTGKDTEAFLLDKLSYLDVSPQPDTVLRGFMAWKRLDNFVNINPQKLEQVQRKGFSLVEWGGTEVKSVNSFSVIQ